LAPRTGFFPWNAIARQTLESRQLDLLNAARSLPLFNPVRRPVGRLWQ
jgi:hypothetical protein